jgi:hypothetical protein
MPSTKREREKRLAQLEEEIATTAAHGEGGIAVEHRAAAPDERPEGMAFDVDERTLRYDFWSSQRDCLARLDGGGDDVVAFLAGYGSGKTMTGARWLLTQALKHPGSRFLAMGVNFQRARKTTYEKLFENLPGERTTVNTSGFNGPESSPIIADYNRTEHQLTLINDATIDLGSADRPDRYAGAEFGGIWMDEPSLYSNLHALTSMMTTRLRSQPGPQVMFWTLTGEGYNDAWEILEKRENEDGDPIGLRIEVVTASTENNPYLDSGEVARFKRKHEGTSREEQALHGGFAAATGLVYSNFSRETHVRPHAEARELVDGTDEWRIYGYDAGWNDPRVLLELGRTAYGQLVVLDEFYESGAHVEDAIAWLDENDKPRGRVFCEHEPSDIQKIKRAGYRAKKASKSIDAGISEVRKRLKADPVRDEDASAGEQESDEAGEGDGDERPGLLISDRCENLIRELHSYKRDQVGTAAAEDHCCDSLRYAVFSSERRPSEEVSASEHDMSDLPL